MLEVRFATEDDIETLVRLRRDFNDEWHPHTEVVQARFTAQFRQLLDRGLGTGKFVAALGFVGPELASGAFLVINDYPADCEIPHGRLATLIDVYTYPQYRRHGYGRQVVAAMIVKARDMGVDTIDLLATKAGEGVYGQVGFKVCENIPMRLVLTTTSPLSPANESFNATTAS